MELSAGFRRSGPPVDPADIGEDEALVARIRAEIVDRGPMPFARFMELALYDPDGGYYRAADARPGREGDFLTAPEAHPIFGHAVARQLTEVWDRLDRSDPFVVHEHGAGIGTLAEAILRGLEADRSDLLGAIRYVPIEIDERRTAAFATRLDAAGFGSVVDLERDRPIVGVVLANEVLDALPVHRVGVRDGRLQERFVGIDAGTFVDAWGEPSTPALAERLNALGVELDEGQSAEICLALDAWVDEASRPLERGLLVLIDYGAPAAELYDPARRPHGTLRAYVRHRVHDDVYRHVGRQDLTAHVDLTSLEEAARAAGLAKVGLATQAGFLVGNGAEALLRDIQADPATTLAGYVELRSALMRLLDPAAMGGFRVAAFGRAWPDSTPLGGFDYRLPAR
jgi:SAM-dependent MidA family methyltransferase